MFPLPVPRQLNLLPSGDLAVPFIKKQRFRILCIDSSSQILQSPQRACRT
jgi:hypothetical protein